MTTQYEITKVLHRHKEIIERIKVCMYYKECGNIKFDDVVVHYPNIQESQLFHFSSTICSDCFDRFIRENKLEEKLNKLEKIKKNWRRN